MSEERVRPSTPHKNEKPCRTLFVRNINYDADPEEVREKFEKFGEIKELFTKIEGRGMAFVTFVSFFFFIIRIISYQNNFQSVRIFEKFISSLFSVIILLIYYFIFEFIAS